MRPPENRRVAVIGYAVSTPLGHGLDRTFQRALKGESGLGRITRFKIDEWVESEIVGEIPDFDPSAYGFVKPKDTANWNAKYILATACITMDALAHAGMEPDGDLADRTGHLVGSALNGLDSFQAAMETMDTLGPGRVSPYLLPNVCANMPSAVAGMQIGIHGPMFSPGGACASGNHAVALAAKFIQTGDADLFVAGGVEFPIIPAIVAGFQNMNATFKLKPGDRAQENPGLASRPFSPDAKGFVLSEGVGILVLASFDLCKSLGITPIAEVAGFGMTSDSYHPTRPHGPSVVKCMKTAIKDAGIQPKQIQVVNCHGTSTRLGDTLEIEALREVFGTSLEKVAITSNKSMLGHSLGATAAIEAILSLEGMRQGVVLPTINYVENPDLMSGVDLVAGEARNMEHDVVMNNAFGFGGTNCCVVFRRM